MPRCSRFTWPVVALAAACLAVIGLGTASAATGHPLLLGERNSSPRVTRLSNPHGVPLELHAPDGSPPLRVDSATRVRRLNATRLDDATKGDIVTRARRGLLPAVQIDVARDGSVVAGATGVTVVRNAAGDYTASWTGLSGRRLAYCSGVRRPAALAGEQSGADGSGWARVVFDGLDTHFSCLLVATG